MLPAQSPIRHQYPASMSVDAGVDFQQGRRPTWDPCLYIWPIQDGNLVAIVPAASKVNYVGVLSRAESSVNLRVWDMTEGSLKWSNKITNVHSSDHVGLHSSRRDFILVIRDTATLFDFFSGIAVPKADCTDVVRVIPGSGKYFKTSQGLVSVDSDVEHPNLPATSLLQIPQTPYFYTMDSAQLDHIKVHLEKGFY